MYLKDKTDNELYDLFEAVIDELNSRKTAEAEQELEELLAMGE